MSVAVVILVIANFRLLRTADIVFIRLAVAVVVDVVTDLGRWLAADVILVGESVAVVVDVVALFREGSFVAC